jgi:hypothetical protein
LVVDQVSESQEQKQVNGREPLWRAALWAGFTHQEECVSALRNGKAPWFSELAPLTTEERVYIMGQLCKSWFPDMDAEQERDAFRMLGRMYGVKRRKRYGYGN